MIRENMKAGKREGEKTGKGENLIKAVRSKEKGAG